MVCHSVPGQVMVEIRYGGMGMMKRRIRLALLQSLLLIASLIFLSHCGRANKLYLGGDHSVPDGDLPQYSSAENAAVTLVLFGTPTCPECKIDHPEIQRLLNAMPVELQKKLYFVFYVPEGANNGSRPSKETSEAYAKLLHIRGVVLSDDLWKKFRSFKITTETQVPAAVVINNKTKAMTKFRAGANTFLPSKIVETVQENLSGE